MTSLYGRQRPGGREVFTRTQPRSTRIIKPYGQAVAKFQVRYTNALLL